MRTYTNPYPTTRYVSAGDVRGECPHWHTTIGGAVACTASDRAACRSLGGGAYSDRDVYAVEGGSSYGEAVEVDAEASASSLGWV